MNPAQDIATTEATDTMASAIQFINSTSSHIFLTGKAGTGKTTFLRNLSTSTHKQFAIVAPTGIAALNAGGVTIHSQFQLPFGMFIPEQTLPEDFKHEGNFYTSYVLASKHPMNGIRRQVLRSIDLLVIDEVSMLRADLLDAIDYRLKAARGNFTQSFGGVQLLFIGDLYQLPPVVKRDEESVLKRYYSNPWFFNAKALQNDWFVYIELDKIFRQQNDTFISLLNNLRNNKIATADIEMLNSHYRSQEEIESLNEVITLTTHNYKADELNTRALNELKTPSHILHAYITDDFPENMHPTLHHLELKEGAQVMFIKNDREDKMYFNGKLATVKRIEGDKVVVEMAGTHREFTLRKETWENKSYSIDPVTQEITEKIIGTFEQYPVKLAWAITVHKSQGLTFDKAIIDVGQAFADGQVYVALSRLRSPEGLILRTRINADVISTNKQVVSFTNDNNQPEALPALMKTKQGDYVKHLITSTFDFDVLLKDIESIQHDHAEKDFNDADAQPVLEQIKEALKNEKENTLTFRKQLLTLVENKDYDNLFKRIKEGSQYYRKFIQLQVNALVLHKETVQLMSRVKTYVTTLTDLDQLFSKKLEAIDKALYLTEAILNGNKQFDFSELTKQRAVERTKMLEAIRSSLVVPKKKSSKKKASKQSKKNSQNTYDVTISLLESGLSIEDIAKERGLVVSTIDGHLAKAVETGRISIESFMTKDTIDIISKAISEMPEGFSSKDLFIKFSGKFNYGQLRAVINHTKKLSTN